MTTALQIALLAGLLISAGLTLAVAAFVPGRPDLRDVIRRYSTTNAQRRSAAAITITNKTERLGVWTMTRLPASWWGDTPTKDLALLQIPLHRHYGKKVIGAINGLLIPPVLSYGLVILGIPIPLVLPPAASIGLAIFLFIAPDRDVHKDAELAREEFTRTLVTFTDLVALERAAGSGPQQSLEAAARIGDSWVFHRISEELSRANWAGEAPWAALRGLADRLDLASLRELADAVSLAKEGTKLYDILRARSTSMRDALLATDLGRAHHRSERMTIPSNAPVLVFGLLVLAPVLLRMLGG